MQYNSLVVCRPGIKCPTSFETQLLGITRGPGSPAEQFFFLLCHSPTHAAQLHLVDFPEWSQLDTRFFFKSLISGTRRNFCDLIFRELISSVQMLIPAVPFSWTGGDQGTRPCCFWEDRFGRTKRKVASYHEEHRR